MRGINRRLPRMNRSNIDDTTEFLQSRDRTGPRVPPYGSYGT